MAFSRPNYNQTAAWTGIFLCAVLAQVSFLNEPREFNHFSDSQRNLLQNAVVPIYLSENRSASIRRLENLIQETDIRRIHVYTSDQKRVAQVLNASVPEELRETQIENMAIVFQGTLAGSVQLDIAHAKMASTTAEDSFAILAKSGVIAFVAWLLSSLYWSFRNWLLPGMHTRTRQPGILDRESPFSEYSQSHPQPSGTGSSLLIYIYLLPEENLMQNPVALRECLSSFARKLDSHLRIYGGRILSISEDRFICRMATGHSQHDLQQALTFCWGIARPMIYRSEAGQFQMEIKSLLHKTEIPAKSGNLYRAISEIDASLEGAVIKSSQNAHISNRVLSAPGSTNFDHVKSQDHPALHQILSVKKSVDVLWQKQASMVSADN